MHVREAQIESILATYIDIAKNILHIEGDLTLLNRQKTLPSGSRIDLLFVSQNRLKLVEIKVVPCCEMFIKQILNYKQQLQLLQTSGQFIAADIDLYLLCPVIDPLSTKLCLDSDIQPIEYSPEQVLASFFERLGDLAGFMTIKPTDHGLWNLHLLNRIIYILSGPLTKSTIAKRVGLSVSTVASYLRLAEGLRLVSRKGRDSYVLTDLGGLYVAKKDSQMPTDFVSDAQAKALQQFIIRDPFSSGVIYGIYSLVDAVFILSRNTHPVPLELAIDSFRKNSGKFFDWASKKAARDATHMYCNYAIEIGLIARVSDKLYITPDGVKFILMLNLHKAIKLVDALGLSK